MTKPLGRAPIIINRRRRPVHAEVISVRSLIWVGRDGDGGPKDPCIDAVTDDGRRVYVRLVRDAAYRAAPADRMRELAETLLRQADKLEAVVRQVDAAVAAPELPRELTAAELDATPAGTVLHWTNWPDRPSVPAMVLPHDDPNGNVSLPGGRKLYAMPDELTRVPRDGLEVHAR
jgi:hypothetical protein